MAALDLALAKPQLEEFLKGLAKTGRFELRFRVEVHSEAAEAGDGAPQILVECDGPDTDLLLARGGELLDALEHLGAKVLRLHSEEHSLVSFDSNGFRALRQEELRLTAETAAERVAHTGAPFPLSPMNSRDRRIVHLALKERPGVRTESEGTGAHRRIIIHPQQIK